MLNDTTMQHITHHIATDLISLFPADLRVQFGHICICIRLESAIETCVSVLQLKPDEVEAAALIAAWMTELITSSWLLQAYMAFEAKWRVFPELFSVSSVSVPIF